MPGLSVSDIVSVDIVLSPVAAQYFNFGVALIVGSSPVIDTTQRIREYTTLTGVAQDFSTTSPEYLAAQAFFSQQPQPLLLKIGRWAQSATNGVLHGAVLSSAQQAAALTAMTAVTTGTLNITIDGTARSLTGLNFSAATNLNAIASVLNTALAAYATVTWNGQNMNIQSNSTGTGSSVGYAATPTGTDIATPLGLTLAAGASVPVAGIAAESAVACLQLLANQQSEWYAVTFAPLVPLSDATAALLAATVEGLSPARVIGFTTQESAALDPTSTTDLAYMLEQSGYSRSIVQYSSTSPYAIAAFLGRALTVNFQAQNSTITMMFKQEIGIVGETLTASQAAALDAKNCNVFVNYQNGTAIVQYATMAGGRFWDEVTGLDWLANAIQTDQYNALYQSPTKIPQTDDGVHTLLTVLENTLAGALYNGLIGPGTWNNEGFGQLRRGDFLPKGYYTYAQSVNSQTQATRETRAAPPLMAAIKLAGAIQDVDVIVNVTR